MYCEVYKYNSNNELVLDNDDTSIGNRNPFRYKSYYLDIESGLYYLNSRYYNPKIGRFITIDNINYIDESSIYGYNLYCYCGNNPVMYSDRDRSVCYTNSFDSSGLQTTSSYLTSASALQRTKSSVPSGLKFISMALPDIITAGKYFAANGIHKYIGYAKKTRYVFPKISGTWRYIPKSNSSFYSNSGAIFKQILTGDAKAGFGAIAKSVRSTVGINFAVNFAFNFYENNWNVDGAMLKDTLIDAAIGTVSYYIAAGIGSAVSAGLLAIGVSIPGGVVVIGVVALSVGIEWLIRELIDYKD